MQPVGSANTYITYLQDQGLKLNSITISWGEDRLSIRNKLGRKYVCDDSDIDIEQEKIVRRKDFYMKNEEQDFYLVLSYSAEDMLEELELSGDFEISIQDVAISSNKSIWDTLPALDSLDASRIEIETEQFLYPKLKIAISSAESMGADGDNLHYFYCSNNIDHLL